MPDELCEYLMINQEKVGQIKKGLAPNELISKMAERFKALSDPSRLKIVLALEHDDLCVCDIAALMGLSQPSVSHHLKSLRQLGIVKFHKSGKMAMYSLRDRRISGFLAVAKDFSRDYV